MPLNVRGRISVAAAGAIAVVVAGAAVRAAEPSIDAPPPRSVPYRWQNVPIVGGGFVSGLVVHPAQRGLMYARTDIGGAYRRDSAAGPWVPITDWVDAKHWNYTGIESLAIDPADPNAVYLAAGTYTSQWAGTGAILRSTDRGRTWQLSPLTIKLGGNENGRGSGERLAVDPNDGSVLMFGSRKDGLWRSADRGATWTRVGSFPDVGDTHGIGIVFVMFDAPSGPRGAATPAIYVGVSSPQTSLYRSADAGQTWTAVSGQPRGLLPHRAAWDERRHLYVTYGDGPGPNGVTDGAVYKLDAASDAWADVSPVRPAGGDRFGYSGVTVDPQRPGVVMVSTLDRWGRGDDVFRSTDAGQTWHGIRERSVRDSSLAPWLNFGKPSAPIGHWICDLKIDPFDSDHAVYETGWGLWESRDLTAADGGGPTHWSVAAGGIEECVVNEVVSPGSGAARVLSVMWDIDGFRHVGLDRSPPWGFFVPQYGQDTSIDFAELDPNVVARVYGGVGVGGAAKSETGGSYSLDNAATWQAFAAAPPGAHHDGTIAVSADGATLVWTPKNQSTFASADRGRTWVAAANLPPKLRVVSDRADAAAFYAFDPAGGTLYASHDGGASFAARATAFAKGEGYLRAVPGRRGDLWLAGDAGLFRSADAGATFEPVPGPRPARRVGFGKAAAGGAYPVVYAVGDVNGAYGFYRSEDRGVTWARVNDDRHQFGDVTSITGDPRAYGRVYVSSRDRGILYGEPQ